MTTSDGRVRTERVRYRFGPLEQRGLIAGWRGGQIGSVAAGLVCGVLALRSHPSVPGVLGALVFTAVGVAVACWPVRGRTGEQWLPLVVRWLAAELRGGHRQRSDAPGLGQLARVDLGESGAGPASVALGRPEGRRARTPPGVFDGLRIHPAPVGDDPADPMAGVVIDARARTATAVLAVQGHSFALLGPVEQDSRITAWARVLAAMAREGSAVHRVQWVESCLPDDGSAVRGHQHRYAELGADTAPGRSYASLVDQSAPVTRRHRVLLALSIHTAHSARAIRGSAAAAAVLLREVVALQRLMEEADATVEGILGPRALASVVRETSAPMRAVGGSGIAADPATVGSREERGGGVSDGCPWPMVVDPGWDSVHVDATWHATYWIAEWPRVEVTPDFLGPLLFSPIRRSISLVMEPVSPSRAARQVAQARTADIADGELRRRGGFLVTARQTREKEGAEDRDIELADGHAQYRFSGYVTVTADSRDELGDACGSIEQAAGQTRMELRRLYGEQDVAFACTLPLGRGLT
ncbi:MAG TPA: SCO6880 family protein [Acidimicrobiales bacterium]|nr:SCO6880 family protein [Acidimicrobiales bacterium]